MAAPFFNDIYFSKEKSRKLDFLTNKMVRVRMRVSCRIFDETLRTLCLPLFEDICTFQPLNTSFITFFNVSKG